MSFLFSFDVADLLRFLKFFKRRFILKRIKIDRDDIVLFLRRE